MNRAQQHAVAADRERLSPVHRNPESVWLVGILVFLLIVLAVLA